MAKKDDDDYEEPATIIQRIMRVEFTPWSVVGVIAGALICLFLIPFMSNLSVALGVGAAILVVIIGEQMMARTGQPQLVAVVCSILAAVIVSVSIFSIVRSELTSLTTTAAKHGPTMTRLGLRFDRGVGMTGTILVIPQTPETPVRQVPCPNWAGTGNLCIDLTARLAETE